MRSNFPILHTRMSGKPLIYLDNAATTHKPQVVIDAITAFYTNHNASVHRGIYPLAENATQLYEQARATVAHFIGAQPHEIVFTRGTTESINMVAPVWAAPMLNAGDEIVLTELEHHANLVVWQQLAKKKRLILRYIPVTQDGLLDMDSCASLITAKTKLVAVTHVSNALGTHVDVAQISNLAHAVGAKVLVDAAQSIAHQKVDVQALGADFLAFSGHKMLGPTGIGVLYINHELHKDLVPYQYGGGMVYSVDYQDASWRTMPHMLEAGTPDSAAVVGLAAAIDYITQHINFDALRAHEASLCTQLIEGLAAIAGITILGPQEQLKKQGHMVSFTVQGYHAHDVAAYLAKEGICVRAGHHCAQPLAVRMGVESSVRASFYGYNTPDEVDRLVEALKKLV